MIHIRRIDIILIVNFHSMNDVALAFILYIYVMAEVRIQSNSEFVQTKLEFQFRPDEIRILSWTEMILDEIRIPISSRRD
jgi:hypothetical protein